MPDNVIEVKVVADATSVPPALDKAAVAAETFVSGIAAADSQLATFSAADAAAATQLDLFAIAEGKAGSQMALFSAEGAVVVPALDLTAQGAQMVAKETGKIPAILSQVVAWFKETGSAALGMGTEVKVGALEAQESVTHFAESAKISATGVTSAFGLIGTAFAGVAIVGVLGEMLEKVQENSIEAEHLATATGVEVVQIVELKDAMKAAGAPSEGLDKTLSRLTKNMDAARAAGSKQAEAFRQLGVDTHGWHDELPPIVEVLEQMGVHLQNSTNAGQDLAKVQTVAGKNVVAFTAFLKSQGIELGENMEKHKAHGEAIEASIPAALRLREAEATLSENFQTLAANILPIVVEALKVTEIAFRILRFPIEELVTVIVGFGITAFDVFKGMGKAILAVAHGDFSGASKAMADGLQEAFSDGSKYAKMLGDNWTAAGLAIKKAAASDTKKEAAPTGETNTEPGNKNAIKIREKELEAELAHQQALFALRKKGYEEQEKLGLISADQNLARLLALNGEEYGAQVALNQKMIELAKSDPNGAEKVAELYGKRQAILDKALASEQALRFHAREVDKRAIDEQYKDYLAAEEKFEELDKKRTGAKIKEIERQFKAQFDADTREALEAEKVTETKLKTEEKHFTKLAELYRQDVDFQYSLGLISARRREELVNKSFDAEAASQRENLQKQLAALSFYDSQYLAKREALLGQLQALEDRMAQQRLKSEHQSLLATTNTFKAFIGGVGSAFESNINSWIKGTKTFSQAFANMGRDILTNWASTLLQMGVKWAEQKALELALHIAGIETKQAADATASTASVAINSATIAAEIPAIAGLAAANAYAATAAIPIIGPELAPIAAATALAAVLSFEGLAFAEQGALIPFDQLAYVHKNEMVLPAHISQGLQMMIAGEPTGGNNSGGGDTHIHYSPSIQALDGAGLGAVLEKNQRVFIRKLQSWNKSGHLAGNN